VSAIDAHVSNCLPCAHALADRHGESGGWVRRGLLGRLVRLDERSPDGAGADAGAEIEKRRAEAA
jgi:hypothetical protein